MAEAVSEEGTTHLAAIDRDGNMVCITPSGGVFRKSAFVPDLGCTLSTRSAPHVTAQAVYGSLSSRRLSNSAPKS
jgi:gamma-glutamyltranspeptidase